MIAMSMATYEMMVRLSSHASYIVFRQLGIYTTAVYVPKSIQGRY